MTTKQSTLVSNRASQTQVPTFNSPANEYGRMRTINGNVALDASADLQANDVIVLAAVPTSAVVLSIKIATDDLDSATTLSADVGLYADAAGTSAKDDDAYASAVTDWRAATSFTEYAFEARGIEKNGQKVWQDAGDSEDPHGEYFIAVTVDAAGDQDGDLAFQIVLAED